MASFTSRSLLFTASISALSSLLLLSSAHAAADVCKPGAMPGFSTDPSQMKGVRTKWNTTEGESWRNTIQPDLRGLFVGRWMRDPEGAGVDTADLNIDPEKTMVDPSDKKNLQIASRGDPYRLNDYLAAVQAGGKSEILDSEDKERKFLSDEHWQLYVDAIFKDPRALTAQQTALISFVQTYIIPNYRYTVAQRNGTLIEFLKQLERRRQACKVAGTVHFIVHQRMWFGTINDKKTDTAYTTVPKDQDERIQQFIRDFSGLINAAKAAKVDGWLSGIRLGENGQEDMKVLMPILPELAKGINANTNNWLKSRIFISNGGGWGMSYLNIKETLKDDKLPFFRLMRDQTAGFAFGYKWMAFSTQGHAGGKMATAMRAKYCPASIAKLNPDSKNCMTGDLPAKFLSYCNIPKSGKSVQCDINDITPLWTEFLGVNESFNDLVDVIADRLKRYPDLHNYAQVIFVGDSSDSLNQMTTEVVDGNGNHIGLAEDAQLVAVRAMFKAAYDRTKGESFGGKLFMNGFNPYDTPPRKTPSFDSGISLISAVNVFCSDGDCFSSENACLQQHPKGCNLRVPSSVQADSLKMWKQWMKY